MTEPSTPMTPTAGTANVQRSTPNVQRSTLDVRAAVRNLTRQVVLAACPRRAETVAWRMRGMIGRNFDGFDALIFPGCGNIHTCFMRMPLDVLFLDGHGRVRALRERLVPWRLCWIFGAQTVVELPAGVVARTGTRPGDEIGMA